MTLRLLLDQNFPRPPGFDLRTVDSTVEAVHVYDHDRGLTEAGTPDWLIYLRAAHDGFDALVTRDWALCGIPHRSQYAAPATMRRRRA